MYCAFVFDTTILDALPSADDRRVEFIRESLLELDAALAPRGGGLMVRHGDARIEIPRLAASLNARCVYANRDYEPQAKARDAEGRGGALADLGIGFELFKDQVVFDGPEVLTQAGQPYTVFTPYKNAWLKRSTDDDVSVGLRQLPANWRWPPGRCVPTLAGDRFSPTDLRQSAYSPACPARAPARRFLQAHAGVTASSAIFLRSRGFPTFRCICASAPFRFASWWRMRLRIGGASGGA